MKNIVNRRTLLFKVFNKFRHFVIFPEGYPSSIFTLMTFHSYVRNGITWYYHSINTEIENHFESLFIPKGEEIFKTKFCLRIRLISTSWLNTLLHLHRMPIKRLVLPQPKSTHLEDGFPLRCLQRLS